MPLEIDYHDINVHKLMLGDSTRCEAFRRALEEVVQPGAAVLDIGAGTGILSIFAARAGARVVYAVERTGIAELARRIVADNGLTDRIQVIHGDVENVELLEPVDIIVSEWLGGYAIDENLLPVIVMARDRWLKPGGKMIPANASSWIAPAYDDALGEDVRSWATPRHGVDLSSIGELTAKRLHCCRNNVKAEHIAAEPRMMWDVDCTAVSRERSRGPFEAEMTFVCRKDGRMNALAAWFESALSDSIALSNKPSDEYTHWGRWVFPIGACLDVRRGEPIEARFAVRPQEVGRSVAQWHVRVGDYSFSSEDMTWLTR